jgi:hypothetical protein
MVKAMALSMRQVIPDCLAKQVSPIEYVTENGFGIIRLCEIDKSIPAVGATHRFLVHDPNGYELHITVHISSDAIAQVGWRCRGRLSSESSYWISLAERHLATYLWEHDDYPADAKLEVDGLSLDDIDLARRWDRDT